MNQLYKITIGDHTFYCGAKDLPTVASQYPNATKIEFIDKKVVFDSSERYELLEEAYDFIHKGANTFTNEKRIELEIKLKKILGQ
jgi:hypothetical protein